MQSGGVINTLDLFTEAKEEFLETLMDIILVPRGMTSKVQFPGPTGTNAVEAALKLARKITGQKNIISFTNGFHGMTLGALAASSGKMKRNGAGVALENVTFLNYQEEFRPSLHEDLFLKSAAVILETVQGVGGLNVADGIWLKQIENLCRKTGTLMIIDDIQVGCGRTGKFFSFEEFAIEPDIIILSKSISGFGTPLSLLIFKPEFDQWEVAEHNGTFRGNNLGFVGGTAAIKNYWETDRFSLHISKMSQLAQIRLQRISRSYPQGEIAVVGRGLILGLKFTVKEMAKNCSFQMFRLGAIAETSGAENDVLKLLPPLTINSKDLNNGLDIIEHAVRLEYKNL